MFASGSSKCSNARRVEAEILLVDDGSPDDTYTVALAQMWRSSRIRAD